MFEMYNELGKHNNTGGIPFWKIVQLYPTCNMVGMVLKILSHLQYHCFIQCEGSSPSFATFRRISSVG